MPNTNNTIDYNYYLTECQKTSVITHKIWTSPPPPPRSMSVSNSGASLTDSHDSAMLVGHLNLIFMCSYILGLTPFRGIVDILNERDGGDSELCLFAMTLINKVR